MRLVSITVENYRSITKAHRVAIGERTVLVGPNNEGKSNILKALVAAMDTLTSSLVRVVRTGSGRVIVGNRSREVYDWETDFPIALQSSKPQGESVIILDFRPTKEEIEQFKSQIGSKLKDSLPLRVCLGPQGAKISVYKKGPGGPALTKKSEAIAKFVASRVEFQHIPAVRTAESAQRIVGDLVDRELARLEANPEYVETIKKIATLQQPVMEALSAGIKQTLVKFLPRVRDVRVEIPESARYRAVRRACEILVDDGTRTSLVSKGDGVQSLAALALMRHAAETAAKGKNLVLAIEEPESHLHSHAIHEIREVLGELSERHQVVLTTHNPLFVDRVRPTANILVSGGRAKPAKCIDDVRKVLGVRASDNLLHAALVLVVEGSDDVLSLRALLANASTKLASAFGSNVLVLDWLQGATNLGYKVGLVKAAVCSAHCILDDDKAAHGAVEKAKAEGVVSLAEVNFLTCKGRAEAEIEDLYDPKIYVGLLRNKYGVNLTGSFKSNKKWSERMKSVFKGQGKPWNDVLKAEVKLGIAQCVATDPANALLPACRESFDAAVASLEKRLTQLSSGQGGY